jgi:hypothetical protein
LLAGRLPSTQAGSDYELTGQAIGSGDIAPDQTGGQYDLTWTSLSSGGAASGGAYQIVTTIGQPAAGSSSGGAYALTGGFLHGQTGSGVLLPVRVYLPVILAE